MSWKNILSIPLFERILTVQACALKLSLSFCTLTLVGGRTNEDDVDGLTSRISMAGGFGLAEFDVET